MKLRVLWFGRPAASPFEDQVETYRQRVAGRWPAEDVALRPVTAGRDGDPRRALAREADEVRRRVPPGWELVALDETGRQVDSERFAGLLADAEVRAVPGLAVAVGSDLGLDRNLRREARVELALSRLTLPHQLARLLLWEQLFRATHILGGGGYHRRGVQ